MYGGTERRANTQTPHTHFLLRLARSLPSFLPSPPPHLLHAVEVQQPRFHRRRQQKRIKDNSPGFECPFPPSLPPPPSKPLSVLAPCLKLKANVEKSPTLDSHDACRLLVLLLLVLLFVLVLIAGAFQGLVNGCGRREGARAGGRQIGGTDK